MVALAALACVVLPSSAAATAMKARLQLTNMLRPKGRRAALTFLALCIALGGAGLACGHPTYGVILVETDTDGNLIARGHLGGYSGGLDLHRSNDGGYTWQFAGKSPIEGDYLADGKLLATTPRATYKVIPSEDTGNWYEPGDVNARIVRTLDGQSETVFSMRQLLDNANILLQQRSSWGPETELYGIHYDADSGNIIAAMGTEGVLVGTPDGRWERVRVGRFAPTDFSAAARTRLLINTPFFWLSTLAVSLLATAIATVLAVARWRAIGGAIILVGGLGAVAYAVYLASGLEPFQAVLLLALLIAVLTIIAKTLPSIWAGESNRRMSLTLVFVGLLLAGAIFVFPGFPGFSPLALMTISSEALVLALGAALPAALPVAFLLIVAIFPYRPEGREWRDAGLSVGSMILVSVPPVVLWMQYIIGYETAKWVSIGLVAVIAIGLFIRLKYLRRSETAAITPTGEQAGQSSPE